MVVQKLVSSTKGAETQTPCYHCGRPNHDAKDCRFWEAECHNCGKLDHIAPVRKSKSVNFRGEARQIKSDLEQSINIQTECREQIRWQLNDKQKLPGEMDELQLFTIGGTSKPFSADLVVNDKHLTMEIDTGADAPLLQSRQFISSIQNYLYNHLNTFWRHTLESTYHSWEKPMHQSSTKVNQNS